MARFYVVAGQTPHTRNDLNLRLVLNFSPLIVT